MQLTKNIRFYYELDWRFSKRLTLGFEKNDLNCGENSGKERGKKGIELLKTKKNNKKNY